MSANSKPEISGRNVLITGGAQGMGLLWARHFLADGARVALWDLSDLLTETKQVFAQEGHEVYTQRVDVTNGDAVERAAQQLLQEFGEIHILVNNAGIVVGGRFDEVPVARMVAVLDVNLKGMVYVTRAFLPGMVERNSGHIVNVSSASGFIGVPFMATYTASKWGVLGFTDSLRLEMKILEKKGVAFTVFCPSYVNTGLFEGAKAPMLTPMLSSEEAVSRGYAAFRRGAYVVREPFMVKVTPALRTLLPRSVFDSVANLLGATSSMREWKGR